MADQQLDEILTRLKDNETNINKLMDMNSKLMDNMSSLAKTVNEVQNVISTTQTTLQGVVGHVVDLTDVVKDNETKLGNLVTDTEKYRAETEVRYNQLQSEVKLAIDMGQHVQNNLSKLAAETTGRYDEMTGHYHTLKGESDARYVELIDRINRQQSNDAAYRENIMVAVLNAFMLQTNRCNTAIAQGNIDILKQLLTHQTLSETGAAS